MGMENMRNTIIAAITALLIGMALTSLYDMKVAYRMVFVMNTLTGTLWICTPSPLHCNEYD